jgi:type I restriction enzyme S subunit
MHIESYIESRYPGEGQHKAYREELIRICNAFVKSGLSDFKFVSDLRSGENGKFWSCISEAIIFDKLQGKNFATRSKVGIGPDFLLMDGGRKIWIEVVCPQPMGVPSEWIEIQTGTYRSVPHNEILLRWCSAIKEKSEKLIGSMDGKVKGYLQTGIVSKNDIYVIAVNGCQLRHGPFQALHGISQYPYAVEAVFSIGPYQLTFDKASRKFVKFGFQERYAIIKPNKSLVPTYSFLDPSFNMVSAIWAVDFNGAGVIGNTEPSALIHNPIAVNSLPREYLQSNEEFIATPFGDGEYQLERISRYTS